MLRVTKLGLTLALLVLRGTARAETGGEDARIEVQPVSVDSVLSIGASTTMHENDAIVTVPGKGRIVATANANVFCSGDETARTLTIDVENAGDVMLDLCEAHLERRDVVIKFIAR